MFSEGERTVVLGDQFLFGCKTVEKVSHHGKGFRGGNHGSVRIGFEKIQNIGGMIRLHVLNDQIIGLSAAERAVEVVQPFVREFGVHRIEHGDFFIEDDVGIIRHPVRNDVLPFKEVDLTVVDSNVENVIGNFHDVLLSKEI